MIEDSLHCEINDKEKQWAIQLAAKHSHADGAEKQGLSFNSLIVVFTVANTVLRVWPDELIGYMLICMQLIVQQLQRGRTIVRWCYQQCLRLFVFPVVLYRLAL